MKTIYWIQRLDTISTISTAILIIVALAFVCLFIGALVYKCDGLDYESEKNAYNMLKKLTKLSGAIILFLIIPVTFIPTKKEMYEIYGVGGTLDYIRKNETLQGIPDKTIKMLDKWLDEKLEEETTEEEKVKE